MSLTRNSNPSKKNIEWSAVHTCVSDMAELKKVSSWMQDSYIEKGGWATFPGMTSPERGVPALTRTIGCADIIEAVAKRIDASAFNPTFPAVFPRFVQHAIWRYCARSGLDVCNGNRVDDQKSCTNVYCQIHSICDRIAIYDEPIKRVIASNIKQHRI
jgi:hypothetical protein